MRARVVAREVLDDLAQDDPHAIQSRRDLQRVHWAMGTRAILLRGLQGMSELPQTGKRMRILELGAGDGSLMLGVARALAPTWAPVDLTLLDTQSLITQETVANYSDVGWTATACVRDAFDWAAGPGGANRHGSPTTHWDLIVANLFLHHFEGAELAGLLRAIADRSDRFLACEPHRAWLSLLGSHLIGALGSNAVTREDAVISVHAGFSGGELSALWPDVGDKWAVTEYAAGLFSHCFRAELIQAD